jgi:nuclear transport factor 2 (NTF2) superfamily protein
MTDARELVQKYISTWEQPNAELRRKAIAEIWAEDGVYSNAHTVFTGHQGIEEAVTEAYENFVKKGYVFRLAKLDTNHEAIRYTWEMMPAKGDEPDGIGTQVVLLDETGRMICDHQFIDKAPQGEND